MCGTSEVDRVHKDPSTCSKASLICTSTEQGQRTPGSVIAPTHPHLVLDFTAR